MSSNKKSKLPTKKNPVQCSNTSRTGSSILQLPKYGRLFDLIQPIVLDDRALFPMLGGKRLPSIYLPEGILHNDTKHIILPWQKQLETWLKQMLSCTRNEKVSKEKRKENLRECLLREQKRIYKEGMDFLLGEEEEPLSTGNFRAAERQLIIYLPFDRKGYVQEQNEDDDELLKVLIDLSPLETMCFQEANKEPLNEQHEGPLAQYLQENSGPFGHSEFHISYREFFRQQKGIDLFTGSEWTQDELEEMPEIPPLEEIQTNPDYNLSINCLDRVVSNYAQITLAILTWHLVNMIVFAARQTFKATSGLPKTNKQLLQRAIQSLRYLRTLKDANKTEINIAESLIEDIEEAMKAEKEKKKKPVREQDEDEPSYDDEDEDEE